MCVECVCVIVFVCVCVCVVFSACVFECVRYMYVWLCACCAVPFLCFPGLCLSRVWIFRFLSVCTHSVGSCVWLRGSLRLLQGARWDNVVTQVADAYVTQCLKAIDICPDPVLCQATCTQEPVAVEVGQGSSSEGSSSGAVTDQPRALRQFLHV